NQKYPGYRWGMSIDVDACVGCQACVVACQAENNVPVVGKASAAYGRQLHWMRLERWAEGSAAHPMNMFLPMLCQHCEVAPCEPACQQTCPTKAITFGNLKDEASEAAKLARSPRAYHVLDEIGTRPSVTYLKKVVREHA